MGASGRPVHRHHARIIFNLCWHRRLVQEIKRLNPSIQVGFTVGELSPEKEARALAMDAHHVGVRGEYITAEMVARCNRSGLEVDVLCCAAADAL